MSFLGLILLIGFLPKVGIRPKFVGFFPAKRILPCKYYLDLKRLEKWNKDNGMNFAFDKNGFLQFRGDNSKFVLNPEVIEPVDVMRDLGVYVRNDLTWSTHIEEKLSSAVLLLHYVGNSQQQQHKTGWVGIKN